MPSNIDVMSKQHWNYYLNTLSIITSSCCRLFVMETKEIVPRICDYDCGTCPLRSDQDAEIQASDESANHLYGMLQAQQNNGFYVYYCNLGYMYLATIIYSEDKEPFAGLITGPFIYESTKADQKPKRTKIVVPRLNSEKLNAVKVILTAIARDIEKNIEKIEFEKDEDKAQAEMMEIVSHLQLSSTPPPSCYPVELENELKNQVRRGDKKGARETINKLFAILYFSDVSQFEVFRLRAYELLTIISRALMEVGGNSEVILALNNQYMSELRHINDLTVLSTWLANAAHQYISLTFDLNEIRYHDMIYKSLQYIDANFQKPISLDDLANHVYLSKSYVSKLFKENVGCTFIEYLNKVRIEHSCDLLLTTDQPISEVALQSGFEDRSYFSKVFKRIMGLTPGQYRQLKT
ncbi:MAG TPA: helix-turn-helix domain-containing protein [Clostridiaceae bacterium]|nr:helix-turn-helix domain-containing protein [Clostridiaceae bacterium]